MNSYLLTLRRAYSHSFYSFYCVAWYLILLVLFFFFFSSRRRHTRFKCDWSSDVCSSDLLVFGQQARFWDTLAIGEFLNEIAPKAGLLPKDKAKRAHCRSICGEMHSGLDRKSVV